MWGKHPAAAAAGPAKVEREATATIGRARAHSQSQGQGQSARPSTLERSASRISTALTHVRSIEYPPQPEPDERALAVHDDVDEDLVDSLDIGHEEKTVGTRDVPPSPASAGKAEDPHVRRAGGEGGESSGRGRGGGEKGEEKVVLDIEHAEVEDDPRLWSNKKKWAVLLIVTFAVLIPILASSIYNPVINEIVEDLHGTQTKIGLSLSLYILFQGFTPTLWAMITEFRGRKMIYIVSYAIYTAALIGASRSTNMSAFIVCRIFQAAGGGAVMAGGAGTLADMYEPHERGKRMGIFYGIPMLGPSIGPLLGGVFGKAFGWRSVFYFLAVCAGLLDMVFIFLPDSWRRERSRSYQRAYARALKRAQERDAKRASSSNKEASVDAGLGVAVARPQPRPQIRSQTRRQTDPHSQFRPQLPAQESPAPAPDTPTQNATQMGQTSDLTITDVKLDTNPKPKDRDRDRADGKVKLTSKRWYSIPISRRGRKTTKAVAVTNSEETEFKIGIRDINPFSPMVGVLKRPTNLMMLTASALLFAAQYTIVYTASITLGAAPYNYNTLQIGLVLLSFGVGNIVASIFGGRFSDRALRSLKRKNGGVAVSEMRLRSTFVAIPTLILSFLAYAWLAQEKVHIAAIAVALFVAGFSILWIYPCTLAYLVDTNPGESATAVSCNSLFRGSLACVMSQVASDIRNGIGDGGLYTLFAGLLAVSTGVIVMISFKGEEWRTREKRKSQQ